FGGTEHLPVQDVEPGDLIVTAVIREQREVVLNADGDDPEIVDLGGCQRWVASEACRAHVPVESRGLDVRKQELPSMEDVFDDTALVIGPSASRCPKIELADDRQWDEDL